VNHDAFILKKLVAGDEDAFKYFFDHYYDDLCNFVNAYVRDENLAEDIVQNIFVDLWENRDRLADNKSLKSYLYSSSKNKSLNHLRDLKNHNRIEKEVVGISADSTDSTSEIIDYEEMKMLISGAIDQLPDRCKEIFQLSRNEELSNKEIAEKLGVSVKTVENQMTIAFRKIKEYLAPYHDKILLLYIISTFF